MVGGRPSHKKTSPSDSDKKQYLGESSFPDGKPVCQPCVPGRRPKPLSGPVHPGFPKPGSEYAKKAAAPVKKTSTLGGRVERAAQNDDVYQPHKKSILGGSKPKRNS